MLERSSNEILKELLGLLAEYQKAVEAENDINKGRMERLEAEVYRLKDKNTAIAHLLLGD